MLTVNPRLSPQSRLSPRPQISPRIALNYKISPRSNKPQFLLPGAYLKSTLLVRWLIRVPCKGEPCSNSRDLLKQQLEIINDNEEDPFKLAEPTEEDREAANPAILLVNEDSY